jgi:hypothetical protein
MQEAGTLSVEEGVMSTANNASVLEFPKAMTLEDIAAGVEIDYRTIDGFKPGQVLWLKSLNAGQFIQWQEGNDGPAKKNAGLRLIVQSVVDGKPGLNGATGELLMNDSHLHMLKKLPAKLTERIVADIVMFNGLNVKGDKTLAEDTAKKD